MGFATDMTEARARQMGISIEPLRIAATQVVFGNSGVSFRGLDVARSGTPPSVLLPRLPGEPLRLETGPPFHPRGAGRNWPPESLASTEEYGPRMPLALAWPTLSSTSSPHWKWTTPEGISQEVTPIAALATAVAAASHHADDVADDLVLVVPNNLRMNRQQELIDSCREHGSSVKLLWRPVAAALSWCGAHGPDLLARSAPCSRRVGRLLCLHLGLDEFELTLLELVERPDELGRWLLPARRRPDIERSTLPSFGLDLVVPALDHPLRSDLWMSPLIGRTLQSFENTANGCVTELLRRGATSNWRTRFAERDAWLPGQTSFADFDRWLNRAVGAETLKDSQSQHEAGGRQKVMFREVHTVTRADQNGDDRLTTQLEDVIGAVITGDLARLPVQGTTLWKHACQKLGLQSNLLTLVEPKPATMDDGDLSTQSNCSLLARGAALHALRLARNEPSYLDTLPRIRTAAYVSGKLSWLDLLKSDDAYEDGGRTWHRPEPFSGLKIQSGRHRIEVAVAHEEFETVRNLSADFPQAVADDVPVLLDVRITPAQGNAQIVVVPAMANAAVRRLQLEWRHMQDSNLSPDEWLKQQPVAYPPPLIRTASRSRWEGAQQAIALYLSGRSQRVLGSIVTTLQQRVPSDHEEDNIEKNATAVSSNGEPAGTGIEVLDQFVAQSVARIPSATPQQIGDLTRAIAYTSTPNQKFQEYLGSRIKSLGSSLLQYDLAACGWCLRETKYIAAFAQAFRSYLRSDPTAINNWLKSFAEMLRYRPDATQDIPTEVCAELTERIFNVFESERRNNNLKVLFKNTCLCIVYLLRRRQYDDTYLAPESPLNTRLREAFQQVIADLRSKRIRTIGGAISLDKALQSMLDYIDLKGSPVLTADSGFQDLSE